MTQTALYRHWDAAGRLLYVGIATDHMRRLMQHGYSPWFDDVVNVSVERFSTRDEAHAAERKAIRKEKPLHNRQRYEGPRVPKPKVKAEHQSASEPVIEIFVAMEPPAPRSWPPPPIFRPCPVSIERAFCSPQRLRMFDEGRLKPLDYDKWVAGGYGSDPFGIAARAATPAAPEAAA